MSSIKLRYEPDPYDDAGKIWLTLKTSQFGGSGFFWSYRDGVKALADGLNSYPLAGVAEASWGYDKLEGENIVLLVRVVPVNSKGDLVAEVKVADLYDLDQRVSATFSTTYAEADVFRQQLDALIEGRTNVAELSGRP